MKKYNLKRIILSLTIVSISLATYSQSKLPDIMTIGTLEEQLTYVHERTKIYENYRAIREDIFQKMRINSLDSLNLSKEKIIILNSKQEELEANINKLNNQINTLNTDMEEAIKNRDSLMFFGIRMNKSAYNKLLWAIIIGLVVLTLIVFMMFKRGYAVTRMAKTDLEDIKTEFEEFRKVAHENKEKLIVGHFNEIKKLKEMRI